MLLGVTMIATVEAFVLAEKLGLSHQALFDVASTGGATLRSLRRLGRGRRRFLRHHQDDPRQERRLTEFNAARKGCKKSHMGKHVASRDCNAVGRFVMVFRCSELNFQTKVIVCGITAA